MARGMKGLTNKERRSLAETAKEYAETRMRVGRLYNHIYVNEYSSGAARRWYASLTRK